MAKKMISKNNDISNLYVSIDNFPQKRKSLLAAIKFSLITQAEYENILEFRSAKTSILKEIKKTLSSINSDYLKLKNLLPNVKNVLSYTEKELSELENQVGMLQSSIKVETKAVKIEESMIERIKTDSKINISEELSKKPMDKNKKIATIKKKKVEINLSKLDRIKNNLKVIEAKLKEV